jgi:hypothetical protein
MKFSYSEVWNDTVGLLRANAAIVTAIAGVFLLLPALLTAHFVPLPEPAPGMTDLGAILGLFQDYFRTNWHWLLLAQLVNMVGTIALYLLFLDARGRSVGVLIAASLAILPFFFVATILVRIIFFAALCLLLVPGLYVGARLALTFPALVAEGLRNPVAAIARSFELTRNNGWRVLGLILLIAVTGAIIVFLVTGLAAILFSLVAGRGSDLALFLTQIVQAVGSAAFGAVLTALAASLYRALAGDKSGAAAFE